MHLAFLSWDFELDLETQVLHIMAHQLQKNKLLIVPSPKCPISMGLCIFLGERNNNYYYFLNTQFPWDFAYSWGRGIIIIIIIF